MAKEDYILKLAMVEQEINRLEQQLQLIEQQILEMQSMQKGLGELEGSKEKQLLANLGRNIFIKTEIQDKNLLVDIGNRIFVKKNISETLKLIESQLEKFNEAKNKIMQKMQEIQSETESIIMEAEKQKEN